MTFSYYCYADESVVYQHESASLYLLPSSNIDLLEWFADGVDFDVIVNILTNRYSLDFDSACKYAAHCYEKYKEVGLIEG